MTLREPGFLRPEQTAPLEPAEEATITAICPGLGQTIEAGGRTDDALWGPYVEMRTGHASDSDIRYHGSSGGVLSAVVTQLLAVGDIDGVVQIGSDPALPVGNVTVISASPQEVLAAAGSRYAASAPLAELGPLLDGEARYAFIGKPCDAAALRALSARDPRVDKVFPYILSFFCAGVPAHRGAEEVLEKLGTTLADTTAFRYRGQGWPGYATATSRDGTERRMSYHDSWGKVLSRHVQHRCKICADGTGGAADLVCADAWDCDDRGYPLFEEGDGTSLIVARTARGKALMEAVEAGRAISTEPFDVSSLAAIQPGQTGRRRVLLARLAALRVLGRPAPRYIGLKIVDAARQARMQTLFKNFAGTIRRALRQS